MTNGRWVALAAVAMVGSAGAGSAAAQSSAEYQTVGAIARARAVDGQLRSIIALDPTAIAQARAIDQRGVTGPLAGKPILVKDNIEVAGPLPTTAGSLALINNISGRDAPLVARMRAAGAVILGKANLSEWANIRSSDSISGWSAVGGQTRNPFALDRNTCGSSAGSGAAVAAGIVDFAIGTETDGSITCPAAVNGIVGMKPTVGLVSRTHIVPISESQDTAGPMTRTVRQAAELLSVIAGSDPADKATREADRSKSDYAAALDANALKGARIGVMRFATGFGTDPAFNAALAVLKARGAVLVEIAKFDRSAIGGNEFTVLLTEFKAGLNDYLASTPPSVTTRTLADVIAFNKANAGREMALFGQDIFERAEKTRGLSDPTYLKARKTSFEAAGPNGIDKMIRDHRLVALVGPTMTAAWKIDAVHGDQYTGGGAGGLAAVAGYPHLTVPMGQVKGLPVGLSFIGGKWDDAKILALGYAYEQARGPIAGPSFWRSIEESPDLARSLEPAR